MVGKRLLRLANNKLMILILFLISFLSISLNSYASDQECAEGVVSLLSVGYDGGSAIKTTIDGNQFFVNKSSTLDKPPGYGLLSLLLYSKATGTPVQLWDHMNTRCIDFDEVYLQ